MTDTELSDEMTATVTLSDGTELSNCANDDNILAGNEATLQAMNS